MPDTHEILVRPARPEDNPALLDLLRRTPQMGSVTLTFEREADFFSGARVACEVPRVLVAGMVIPMTAVGGSTVAAPTCGDATLIAPGICEIVMYSAGTFTPPAGVTKVAAVLGASVLPPPK